MVMAIRIGTKVTMVITMSIGKVTDTHLDIERVTVITMKTGDIITMAMHRLYMPLHLFITVLLLPPE